MDGELLDEEQPGQWIGLPVPASSGLTSPALVEAYGELLASLEDVGLGGIALEAWQHWGFYQEEGASNLARLTVLAGLCPGMGHFYREVFDNNEAYDFEEGITLENAGEDDLGYFGRLVKRVNILWASDEYQEFSRRLPGNPAHLVNQPVQPSTVSWTVSGAVMGWEGKIQIWPFGEDWFLVTALWETLDYPWCPNLLGFASGSDLERSVGRVVAATIGPFIGPLDELD